MPLLSIVIPVFNEESTLERVLEAVNRSGLTSFEVIVVDDCSTDGTRGVISSLTQGRVDKVVFHEKNRGKGAALRSGIAIAEGDYVVFQDADLEYDPGELPALLAHAMAGDCEVVYGSRLLHVRIKEVSPFWHRTINHGLTAFSNWFTGLKLTDMETCYKLVPTKVLKSIDLEEDRFGVEPELTAKLAQLGLRFKEVPISYARRSFEEGKKIGAKDGIRAMYVICKYGLRGL